MQGLQEMRGMLIRITGNLLEDSRECSHLAIPRNSRKDSGECSRRFGGMFQKIAGNAFNFKLIKATFYLKKANAKLISEA